MVGTNNRKTSHRETNNGFKTQRPFSRKLFLNPFLIVGIIFCLIFQFFSLTSVGAESITAETSTSQQQDNAGISPVHYSLLGHLWGHDHSLDHDSDSDSDRETSYGTGPFRFVDYNSAFGQCVITSAENNLGFDPSSIDWPIPRTSIVKNTGEVSAIALEVTDGQTYTFDTNEENEFQTGVETCLEENGSYSYWVQFALVQSLSMVVWDPYLYSTQSWASRFSQVDDWSSPYGQCIVTAAEESLGFDPSDYDWPADTSTTIRVDEDGDRTISVSIERSRTYSYTTGELLEFNSQRINCYWDERDYDRNDRSHRSYYSRRTTI